MDWNLKATSWDLSEFEREAVPNIDASDGSSTLGGPRTRKDFSVDLKLGHVGHSGDESMNKWKDPGISKTESSPSGSSKRARAANSGTQTVSCLVDGCNADLSNCRDYHRRHKVCELHSKTPQVMINGQKQRFCQQCSRFHSLEEFDEGKRSCRKRLDGHNRRRRKPQPDPLSRPSSFLSGYQGTQLLPLSNSHVYPSTNVVNPTWAGVVNTEMDARHYNQQRPLHSPERQNFFLGSSPGSSYKAGKQFQFLPGDGPRLNHQTSQEASICQPLLRAVPMSESGGGHSMFCDRLTTRVHDSDCALSLLSSPQTQTSGISLSHMVQPSSIPLVQPGSISLVQPLGPGLNKHSFEPMDSVLVSNSRDANDHYSGMFPIGSDGLSSANEASQTLPFHWG